MNLWNTLGINKTKNKMEIKEAYMMRLQVINPEDDEEGFKKLRAEYEEAMKFADSDDIKEEEDTTPIGIWINRVKEVYNKFSLRIDENAWIELLEADVCFAIDSREEARNKILEFLMDYYYLPKKIWLLFDDYFSLGNKRDELIENFPENFINYVMDKVNPNYSDNLDYYLFEEIDDSKNYDSWLSLYFKIQREINNKNMDELKKDLSEIEEFHIKHPLLDTLYLRYYISNEENEKAREIGQNLLKRYPNEIFALYGVAEVEWNSKNYQAANEYYKKVLEISPNNYNAKVGLADCFLETYDFKEAERIFEELLDEYKYDNYVRNRLFIAISKIIEELEKECENSTKDKKIELSLGWYYFKNYRYDDIINLCSKFEPQKEDENQYFDLLSKAYFEKEDYDLALEYLNKFERNLNSEEENREDKQSQFQKVYYQRGRILCEKEEYEDALYFYDKSLDIESDNISVLNSKSYVLNRLERYEESLKNIEKGLEIDDNHFSLHINKSDALYELRYYKDAMDECNIAIEIYPYYSNPYLIKMKIYFVYDEYDEILEIADELERLNIVDYDANIYKIKALRNKDMLDEAESLALNILKDSKENNATNNLNKIYYELAAIQYDKCQFEKALEYINRGIEEFSYNEDNFYFRAATYRCLKKYDLAIKDYDTIIVKYKTDDYWFPTLKKAEIYEEVDNLNKALELYKEVLKIDPENRSVNNSIGEIYEKLDDDTNALKYFNRQLEVEESNYYYINRGLLYARNNKFEEAKADYESAMELNPENPYAYNNLGYLYQKIKKFEEAIPYYQQAIEKGKERRDPRFYNNLADCYIGLENNEMALKCYDDGIELLAYESSLYYNKAKLLKKIKLYNEAIEVYKKGMELEDADLEDYYDEISDTYKMMEEYDNSLCWAKKVIEVNSNSKYGYKNIGDIYNEIEDYKSAVKYFKLQIKVDNNSAINYLLLAEAYNELSKNILARMNFKTALEKFQKVKNKTAHEYCNIGACYNGLKETSEAFKNLEKSINIEVCRYCDYKGCYEGYYEFGRAFELEKKYEEALKYYKKALELNEDDKTTKKAIERIENLLK